MHTEEKPCADTKRRLPPESQGEKRQEKPNLWTPWTWTSRLQNCKKINFCYLILPVVFCYGSPRKLLQWPSIEVIETYIDIQIRGKSFLLSRKTESSLPGHSILCRQHWTLASKPRRNFKRIEGVWGELIFPEWLLDPYLLINIVRNPCQPWKVVPGFLLDLEGFKFNYESDSYFTDQGNTTLGLLMGWGEWCRVHCFWDAWR